MMGKASGQQLLLPANPVFIWTSVVVGLLVNLKVLDCSYCINLAGA